VKLIEFTKSNVDPPIKVYEAPIGHGNNANNRLGLHGQNNNIMQAGLPNLFLEEDEEKEDDAWRFEE